MKKILGILVFTMLIVPVFSVGGNMNFYKTTYILEEIKDQYQEDREFSYWLNWNKSSWQEFIPTKKILVRIEVYIKHDYEDYSSLTLYINQPESFSLTSMTIPSSEIPENPGWVSFDIPDINVIPGISYYINLVSWENGNYAWYGADGDKYSQGDSNLGYRGWCLCCDYCFRTFARTENSPPNKPSTPIGIINGRAGLSYQYSSSAIDTNGDYISYLFDWGDGNDSGWTGFNPSGETVAKTYKWEKEGNYQIKVKSRDRSMFAESPWSDPLSISMPKNKAINPFMLFLERLIERFPILEQILQPIYDKLTGL